MPEHQECGEVMRELIDRCSGKSVSRMQASHECRTEQQRARTMDRGIAKVSRDGISAVLRLNTFDGSFDLVKSFRPTDALPTIFCPTHRIFQPIFIRVNVLQRDRFRTNMPTAERIILISANIKRPIITDPDLDPADRLTQIAASIMNFAWL